MLLTLSVEESQARVVALPTKTGVERVPLGACLGRILSEELVARESVPPQANSAMDGFAARAADLLGASHEHPVRLRVVGESAAGHVLQREVAPGEAARIMTGALIPKGADCVVMVERTRREGADLSASVLVEQPAQVGEHIRNAGDDIRKDDTILRAGECLTPAAIGLLASQQRSSVHVTRKPIVSILSTGDELRDVDQPLDSPAAIADSNSYALAALVREAGGEPRLHPIVRDHPADVRAAIESALTSDLILSTGGVSVGEHDHVKEVLTELGAELVFWRVAMKPGKPVALFKLGNTAYFGLPGNPVSAMVSFFLFVRPAIRVALGCLEPFDLTRVEVILDSAIKASDRRHYVRARIRHDRGAIRAMAMPKQGSHVLTSMLHADALLIVEPGISAAAGDRLAALLLPQTR